MNLRWVGWHKHSDLTTFDLGFLAPESPENTLLFKAPRLGHLVMEALLL